MRFLQSMNESLESSVFDSATFAFSETEGGNYIKRQVAFYDRLVKGIH